MSETGVELSSLALFSGGKIDKLVDPLDVTPLVMEAASSAARDERTALSI